MWKSSQNVKTQRSAVRSIAWLDDLSLAAWKVLWCQCHALAHAEIPQLRERFYKRFPLRVRSVSVKRPNDMRVRWQCSDESFNFRERLKSMIRDAQNSDP